MAESTKPSAMPYVWAALILFLIAALFIVAILYIRPELDPLILISAILGAFSVLFSSVAAYLKSQETHLSVNSQLTEWKKEFFNMAKSEGLIEGAKTEQARIAEQTRLKMGVAAVPVAVPMPMAMAAPVAAPLAAAPAEPIAVVVKNVQPVPVVDKSKK